jgi:hypothetical protein
LYCLPPVLTTAIISSHSLIKQVRVVSLRKPPSVLTLDKTVIISKKDPFVKKTPIDTKEYIL